jgi:hypothetical protein
VKGRIAAAAPAAEAEARNFVSFADNSLRQMVGAEHLLRDRLATELVERLADETTRRLGAFA